MLQYYTVSAPSVTIDDSNSFYRFIIYTNLDRIKQKHALKIW